MNQQGGRGRGEGGVGTHALPHVLDLGPDHATLGVLVSHPELSAAVDHATVDALQHKAEEEEEMVKWFQSWGGRGGLYPKLHLP